MKIAPNQIAILIAVISLLFYVPVVFTQQGSDRHDVSSLNPRQLMDDGQYEEALPVLHALLRQARQQSRWRTCDTLSTDIARCWFALSKHDSACVFLENAIQILSDAGQKVRPETGGLFNHLAVNYANQDLFVPALSAYQQAIGIFEQTGALGTRAAYAYKNAAQIFVRWDNHTLAQQYFEAAIRVDTSGIFRAATYAQLANGSHYAGNEDAVLRYYSLGMAEHKRDEETTAHLQAAGSTAFIAGRQYEEAKRMLQSAIGYYRTEPKIWADNILRCLTNLAEIATLQNHPREAEQYYQKAEAEGKAFYKGKSREMAKLYVETGLFYEKTGKIDRALEFYQKALIQAFPNFNSLNISDNPPVADAWLESQAMRAAAVKAQVLLKKVETGTRLNAAHCFDLSFAVAAQLRRTYGNDADKFALAANNRENYTAAALNLWQLRHETNDPAVIARLFALLEQTKAQALGDALQQQRALALTGIPDSLLDREENLRLEVAAIGVDLKKKELSSDSAAIVKLKAHSFRQTKAYDDFLDELKKQYPQFQQFTQAGLTADLSVIQASLPDTAVLLSWFDAGDCYLCIAIRRDGLSAYEVSRDSLLDKTLSQFLGTLSDKNSQQTNPVSYFNAAHFLFQKLLPEGALPASRSLIIIPDGRLCYLPFEALLTAPHSGVYADAPYLLRSKTVQYAWSATLLTLPETGKHAEDGLLQVAPFAESARDGLAPLPGSLDEAPESVGAMLLSGASATTTEFLGKAPSHSVLHLSTHADAGGSDVPGIELFDRRLTLPEILAQRFHASLVSLSACETGTGRFAEGEGVLSLARAFAYAGAQSLLASHWSVNERSTAELFSAFYTNLKKGLPKAAALRQAKLSYLSSTEMDARKAPFHWAAFTLTGADGQVDLANGSQQKWIAVAFAIFILILIAGWFYFRNTGNTTPDAPSGV